MKIKATDMEKIFGLSPNGIRLYEKYGILRVARKADSRYRLYDPEALQAMGCGVQLRRYGFSMGETARLLGAAEDEEQLQALEARGQAIDREIEGLAQARKSLTIQVRRIRQAHQLLDQCAVGEKPAMYFLGVLRGQEPIEPEAGEMLGQWVKRYAPHLSTAVLLDGPYLTRERYDQPPLRGVALDAEMALALGLYAGRQVVYLPPKPCVVTALRFSPGEDLTPHFARVRRYARDNQLTLYAGGLLRQVQCAFREGKCMHTALLYAPLAGDEDRFGQMR